MSSRFLLVSPCRARRLASLAALVIPPCALLLTCASCASGPRQRGDDLGDGVGPPSARGERAGAAAGEDGRDVRGGDDRFAGDRRARESAGGGRVPAGSAAGSRPRTPSRPDGPRAAGRMRLSPEVADLVERLSHPDPRAAERAFWKLTVIDRRFIPELLPLVTSEAPTTVSVLKILVRENVGPDEVRVTPFRGYLASRIPGMGLLEKVRRDGDEEYVVWQAYDDRPACTVAENRKGYKVVLERKGGFPLGIVIRAALLDRFRSLRYPRGIDHTKELERWWRAYYRRVFGSS